MSSDINFDVEPESEPVSPSLPPPLPASSGPRVWPAFVVAVSAIAAAAMGGGMLLVVYLMMLHGADIVKNSGELEAAITSASTDPVGFLMVSVPGQLAFLFTAIGAAILSRGVWTDLLSYRRSIMRWWSWLLLAVATPFVTTVGVLIQRLCFGEESEQLAALGQMAKGSGEGFPLAPTLVIGVLAPVAEETLFRGYVQQRLLKRWSPWLAISISSAFFLIAHWEPAHIVAILPFSLWLGAVAWRTQSVWPAVLCHATQNLLFVFANQMLWTDELQQAFGLFALVSMVAFGAAVVALWRRPSLT